MYLSNLGYNKKSSEVVLSILDEMDIFDDISLYQICNLVTQWEIPINDQSKDFLKKFESKIISFSFKRKLPTDFYCVLWFKAKYNHPEELLKFIEKYKNLWQIDTFLRRQVTAILSRLVVTNSKVVERLLFNQISSGVTNTVTLANQIFQFSTIEKIEGKLSLYLFPKIAQRPYPLGKYMVLCSVLNSEKIRTDPKIRDKIKDNIKDPFYLKWLDYQYNIS